MKALNSSDYQGASIDEFFQNAQEAQPERSWTTFLAADTKDADQLSDSIHSVAKACELGITINRGIVMFPHSYGVVLVVQVIPEENDDE